jgi:phosphatidylethanolamine-binding protein (PEBP) family uncharacterized protein
MRDHDAPGGDFIHWAIAHVNPDLVASARAGSVVLPAAAKPPGAYAFSGSSPDSAM